MGHGLDTNGVWLKKSAQQWRPSVGSTYPSGSAIGHKFYRGHQLMVMEVEIECTVACRAGA